MKAIVALKRVADYQAKITVKADHSDVDLSYVKQSINPFDAIALEEAVRCREQGKLSDIMVVSIGESAVQESLRQALALGADRALLLETQQRLAPLHIAQLLQQVVIQEAAELVLLGKQAIDGDNNQTGQLLAGLLDWPQATFASKLELSENHALVTRELDEGLQTVSVQLPAVITTDLRLNTPRLVALPDIIKAKTKPLITEQVSDKGLDLTPRLTRLRVEPPPQRAAGEIKHSLAELLAALRQKTELIP